MIPLPIITYSAIVGSSSVARRSEILAGESGQADMVAFGRGAAGGIRVHCSNSVIAMVCDLRNACLIKWSVDKHEVKTLKEQGL